MDKQLLQKEYCEAVEERVHAQMECDQAQIEFEKAKRILNDAFCKEESLLDKFTAAIEKP